MKNNLTNFDKKFITSNVLLYLGGFIYDTIFNFYIWEKSSDIRLVIVFSISFFLFVLIGVFISEYLVSIVYAKFLRALGIILMIPYGVIILLMDNVGIVEIVFLGVIYGIAVGIRAQPFNVLVRNYLNPDSRAIVDSITHSIDNGLRIFFPLLLSQIISFSGNYNFAFVIAILLTILSTIPIILVKNKDENKSKVDFKSAFGIFLQSSQIRNLIGFKYFQGFRDSIVRVTIGIITFQIVGGIGNWGLFNTFVTILTIIVSMLIGRKLKLSTSPLAFAVLILLSAIGSIYFANDFAFSGLIVFTLSSIPYNALLGSSEGVVTGKIIDREIWDESLTDEIFNFFEIGFFFGRVSPLIILLLIGTSFDSHVVLRMSLVLIGVASICMLTLFDSLGIVKRRNDPFLNS